MALLNTPEIGKGIPRYGYFMRSICFACWSSLLIFSSTRGRCLQSPASSTSRRHGCCAFSFPPCHDFYRKWSSALPLLVDFHRMSKGLFSRVYTMAYPSTRLPNVVIVLVTPGYIPEYTRVHLEDMRYKTQLWKSCTPRIDRRFPLDVLKSFRAGIVPVLYDPAHVGG